MPMSPGKPRLCSLIAKWLLTILFFASVVLFLFSLVGMIDWESPGVVYCANLSYGSLYFGRWNPEYAATSTSMPPPGWSCGFCTYMGASIEWLPQFINTRTGTQLGVPIWIPAVIVGALAAALWWRQRRATAVFLRCAADRLRPARPLNTRVWAVIFATVAVAFVGFALGWFIESLPPVFHEKGSIAAPVTSLVYTWGVGALILGSPLLGFLIVRLWVRFRNHLLFASGAICRHCGYNLTGNVSGVCPECGISVISPKDA